MINFYINSGSNNFLADISGSTYTTGSWSVTLVQDLDQSSGSFDVTLLSKKGYNNNLGIFTVSGSSIIPTNFGQYTLSLSEYISQLLIWSQANLIYSTATTTWGNASITQEKEIFVDRAFIQSGSNQVPITVYAGNNPNGAFKTYNGI